MNAQELSHLFVHGWDTTRSNQKTASNQFVIDSSTENYMLRTAYSYGHHYPMAIIHQSPLMGGDEPFVIVNRSTYSVTTSKHVGQIQRAVPHWYNTVYLELSSMRSVMEAISWRLRSGEWSKYEPNILRDKFLGAYEYFDKFVATKKRITNEVKDNYRKLAGNHHAIEAIYAYLEDPCPLEELPELESFFSAEIVQKRKDADVRRKKVDALMVLISNDLATEQSLLIAEMFDLFDENPSDHSDERFKDVFYAYGDGLDRVRNTYADKASSLGVLATLEHKTDRSPLENEEVCQRLIKDTFYNYCDRKEYAEKLELWRSGVTNQRPYAYNSPVALRVVDRGEYFAVETTQGATVPETTVKLLWRVLKRMRNGGETFYQNLEAKVPPYTGIIVQFGVTLTVGCHVIPWSEIEYVRQTMGWLWYEGEELEV